MKIVERSRLICALSAVEHSIVKRQVRELTQAMANDQGIGRFCQADANNPDFTAAYNVLWVLYSGDIIV